MKILCTGGSGFIGTHLIDSFLAKGIELINVDIAKPKKQTHNAYWRECNILDLDSLKEVFREFQPSHIVHLAARATMEGKSLDDFRDNTVGTANVLEAVKKTASVSRVVITSSQHVRKPGSGLPQHDEDFAPHGLYGESKVITEQLTRRAELSCTWTIIRPTTVWGPWHPFLPGGLWTMMKRGVYFHPKNDPVIRSYGYVKNVVWGIGKILNAPPNIVDKRVFYLGDEPIKQSEWIDSFSLALIARQTPKIPKEWIFFLARIGDIFEKINIRFPMNSPRYFNLTTTNPVPIDTVIKQFGAPPYSLDQGIAETVLWLKNKGRVWK
ncbi:MAG: NAD(P)-dependent oxidoreductase [bacterium]|nr:NAD(P)-dependent oxidoreductase [bacterium]